MGQFFYVTIVLSIIYKVTVRTHEAGLSEDKPIIPGMTVESDILTGKKSVLAYLMKPVLRAKQYALTER